MAEENEKVFKKLEEVGGTTLKQRHHQMIYQKIKEK